MKKITAAFTALIMVLAFCSCGKQETLDSSASDVDSSLNNVFDSFDETTAADTGTSETASDESTTAAEESTTEKTGVPTDPAEILALYTKVMNKAKSEKVGFTQSEWQELPSDSDSRVVSKGSGVVNAALNVANNFMTSESDAKNNPTVYEKGGDMAEFPIRNTPYGCTLTDTSALKSITCKENSNGQYQITLVLKDETNPEPAPAGTGDSPSNHGKVITPISKKEIDENINGSIVSAVAKDITYNLVFHDTESTVIFDPDTLEIVALKQVTRVRVSGSGKIGLTEIVVDKQELINTNQIYDLKY